MGCKHAIAICLSVALCAGPALAKPVKVHGALKGLANLQAPLVYNADALPLPRSIAYDSFVAAQPSPLKLKGALIGALDQPHPAYNPNDRLARLDQQHLTDKLSGYGWQSATLASEFRWVAPQRQQTLISPYMVVGVTLTSLEASPASGPASSPNAQSLAQGMTAGWRYGGGFALSWSDTLDIRLGYQASAMPNMLVANATPSATDQEWRTQLMDVSLSYRF